MYPKSVIILSYRVSFIIIGVKDLSAQTEALRELAALLDKHHLTEIEYESGDLEIKLRREPMAGEVHVGLHSLAAVVEIQEEARGTPVEAPFTGIFYRAPKPNEPPFVQVGDHVEEGQAVGLLEANKVFSELTSPVYGTVVKLVVENGALVQPGEALLFIEPEAE